MQGNRLLALACGVLFFSSAFAQEKQLANKAIYKWERDGLIYYSHIKPTAVKDFIKLDAEGRRIEDFTEEFDEVVEIVVARPDTVKKTTETDEVRTAAEEAQLEVEQRLADNQAEEARNKHCQTARKNMATLDSGEVYERDSQGNMIRLKSEQITSKRKNAQRDIDYFCSEQ